MRPKRVLFLRKMSSRERPIGYPNGPKQMPDKPWQLDRKKRAMLLRAWRNIPVDTPPEDTTIHSGSNGYSADILDSLDQPTRELLEDIHTAIDTHQKRPVKRHSGDVFQSS